MDANCERYSSMGIVRSVITMSAYLETANILNEKLYKFKLPV
jgi:hypothetical protein